MNKKSKHIEIHDLAGSLLNENHTLSFQLKGYSMYPALKLGYIGLVETCRPENIKKGDIVVFKQDETLIGHRIIKIEEQNGNFRFTTKGDNNPVPDKTFAENALLGKINTFEKNGQKKSINTRSMQLKKQMALYFPQLLIKKNKFTLRFIRLFEKSKKLSSNFSLIAKNSGKSIFWNSVISVLQGIMPLLVIVCIKNLIDYLTKNDGPSQNQIQLIYLLAGTAFIFLLNGMLTEIRTYTSERLSQSVIENIYNKLHKKHSTLSISYYENPEEQNKMHRALQEASFRPLKIINEFMNGLRSVASSIFLAGIFIYIKWYLAGILLVAILPGIYFRLKYSRKLYHLKTSQSANEREMYYYNRILTGFPFAKEHQLFGFTRFFKSRFDLLQQKLFREKLGLQKSELYFELLAQAFSVILIFVALGYVSYMKINGLISIGTVVLFFFAFQRGYSILNDFFRSFTQIVEDNTFLNDFISFLELPDNKQQTTDAKQNFDLKNEIRVDNVSFRYETSKRNTLDEINLTIPVGKTVAFVGANGSGKTTLVKLLCGFYEPAKGSIFFDDKKLQQIGEEKIRKNISAVFQDFALYNISAFQNIALGNSQLDPENEKVRKAAEDAGIADILDKLPKGFHNILGTLFESGEELSIGQWQKMAIARAFYRNAPILIMDEPSSALDTFSEKQMMYHLKKLAKNKTSILISHRLSSVQWVDKIFLFDNGKVIESGTHNELMEKKRGYYQLYSSANEDL